MTTTAHEDQFTAGTQTIEVEMSRYTLRWIDGPVPVGTKLYASPIPAPAVPEFCAVEAQLTLAETEMLNAKAWSAGTQAKRHIDFAMTAICCARALLQSAEVKK